MVCEKVVALLVGLNSVFVLLISREPDSSTMSAGNKLPRAEGVDQVNERAPRYAFCGFRDEPSDSGCRS